jgi:signal transduction histidine kinase
MNEKILVVDDEQDILRMLSKLLIQEQFRVKTAQGGEEAIALFQSEPFDTVITDMRMPGMDGLALIKRLKEIDKDIEVIIMSGFAAMDNVIEAFRYNGAFDYLTKPFEDINELFITINRAIKSRRLKIQNHVLFQKLNLANKNLENRVSERTYELSEANDRLQCELKQREKTEKELKKSMEAAEAANRAKSSFLSNMSHELRTPLNHIIGFSELIADESLGPLNKAQGECMEEVVQSSRHLLSLINDILDLSMVESGRAAFSPTMADPALILDNSLVMVRQKALKHNITIKTVYDPISEPVFMDMQKFKQIIYNLISNAIKFTPDDGTVLLNARKIGVRKNLDIRQADRDELVELCGQNRDDRGAENNVASYIEISIADTGVGIKPENLERIFERFEQVDGPLDNKSQGTGLGLSITRALVELHNGRIWAESDGPDKGSTFRFIFPTSPDISTSLTC